MGKERTVVQTSSNQSAQYTATPEEQELNRLQLAQAREFDPIQRELNLRGGNLVNNLLAGQPLPGYLGGLPGGISEDVTSQIVRDSIRDLQGSFQSAGLLDSGVNAAISARTAADIRTQSAQFNLQNLQQLLNIAVGGQAQVQTPQISQSGILSQRLAGLRGFSGTTTGNQTTIGMNPFMKSFQQGLGQSLGGGSFGALKFGA